MPYPFEQIDVVPNVPWSQAPISAALHSRSGTFADCTVQVKVKPPGTHMVPRNYYRQGAIYITQGNLPPNSQRWLPAEVWPPDNMDHSLHLDPADPMDMGYGGACVYR